MGHLHLAFGVHLAARQPRGHGCLRPCRGIGRNHQGGHLVARRHTPAPRRLQRAAPGACTPSRRAAAAASSRDRRCAEPEAHPAGELEHAAAPRTPHLPQRLEDQRPVPLALDLLHLPQHIVVAGG